MFVSREKHSGQREQQGPGLPVVWNVLERVRKLQWLQQSEQG